MLLFHIFNTETIDRSIVFKTIKTAAELFTGNLSNFRGIFNWTSLIGQTTVIVMRDPLALSSLSRNPDFCFPNFKNFKIFITFQNFHMISKFSKDFKNFSFHKISKFSKKNSKL